MLKCRLTLPSQDFSSCVGKINGLLSKKLKEDVEFTDVSYDSSIVGGFIAEVNGKYYDASVAERLFRMKQYILG